MPDESEMNPSIGLDGSAGQARHDESADARALEGNHSVDIRESLTPLAPGDTGGDVVVRVRDPWLNIAITAMLHRTGYRVIETDSTGEAFVVTDEEVPRGMLVTRLIDDRSGPSQAALNALLDAEVGALVSKSEPGHLPVALAAVSQGMIAAPRRIVEAAQSIPQLTQRQAQILNCIGKGMSNPQIAKRLCVSEASIKRVVSNLLRVFEANSRVELAMRSAEIGYRPKPR